MKRIFVFIAATLCCASFVLADETISLEEIVVTPTGS